MVWLKVLTSLTPTADGLPGLSRRLAPSLLTALRRTPARGGARSPVSGKSKEVWHVSVGPWSGETKCKQGPRSPFPHVLLQDLLCKALESIHCRAK